MTQKRGGTAPNTKNSIRTTTSTAFSTDSAKIQNNSVNTKEFIDFSGANSTTLVGFINLAEQGTDAPPAWMDGIERASSKGAPALCNRPNATFILEHLLGDSGRLYRDIFEDVLKTKGGVPWSADAKDRIWSDYDDAALRTYLQQQPIYMAAISNGVIDDALMNVGNSHQIHPIRQYLSSLVWDGKHRIDEALHYYLGADATDYTRAVTRKTFVAACKRVFEPACKFDYILVLVGTNGKGKSKFWATLGGAWYSASAIEFRNPKAAMEQLRAVWIYEIGDLAGLSGTDAEAVKSFIDNPSDDYRGAYAHRKTKNPRQLIFVASTNKDAFLMSQFGNRRWWPVDIDACQRIFKDTPEMLRQLEEDKDQIWAEAMHYYKEGEKLYLDDATAAEAERVQAKYNIAQIDPLRADIEQYLSIKLPLNWKSRNKEDRRHFYQNHKTDADLAETGEAERNSVIYEEFAWEWLGTEGSMRDRREAKKSFSAIMKLRTGWKLSNPTSYKPYSSSTRVFLLERPAKAKTEDSCPDDGAF
jgi:predicted P-loop ATPase